MSRRPNNPGRARARGSWQDEKAGGIPGQAWLPLNRWEPRTSLSFTKGSRQCQARMRPSQTEMQAESREG